MCDRMQASPRYELSQRLLQALTLILSFDIIRAVVGALTHLRIMPPATLSVTADRLCSAVDVSSPVRYSQSCRGISYM